jgi:hypothetical protein
MDRAAVKARAAQAHSFLDSANLIDELGVDAGVESTSNVIATLSVLAGIAASDAICGSAAGHCASGENHSDAVKLLKANTPPGDTSSAQLARLLNDKSAVEYSPRIIGDTKAREMLKSAERLVANMDKLLR